MSIYPFAVTSNTPTSNKWTFVSKRRRLAALAFAFGLAASACGTSTDEAATTESTAMSADANSASETTDDTNDQAPSEEPAEAPAESNETTASTATTAPTASGETKRARLGDQLLVANQSIQTGRFEGRISVSLPDFPEGVEMILSGEYNDADESSEVSLDIGALMAAAAEAEGADMGPFAAMLEEPLVVRTIGSRSFVSWSLLSLLSGGQGTWIEGEAEDADDITSTFGAGPTGSPAEFLSALEEANADITEIGTEDVRGVSTTHLRAIVDLAELDAAISDEERETLERDLGQLDTTEFPIDFWIGDDGLIRRYAMELDQVDTDGDGPSEGSVVFEFFDYGADISIEVPPADEIISADDLDLEGFDF